MSKKHFITIAKTINDNLVETLDRPIREFERVEKVARDIAETLKQTNERFNEEEFLKACGVLKTR